MTVIVVASEDNRGLQGVVSAHFGRCPYYTLIRMENGTVGKVWVEKNPHYGAHQPGQMPRFIRSLGADVILAGGMGPRAVQMFQGYGIDVATGFSGPVDKAVDAYIEGTLRGVTPCNHDHPESCGGHDEAPAGGATPTQGPDFGEMTLTALPRRVVFPAKGDLGLTAELDPRFGRAPFFLVVDTGRGEVVQTLVNEAAEAAHGAGTGAAALMAKHEVGGVVAGRFGPKAHQALVALQIALWTAPDGLTVAQALEKLRAGQLSAVR